MKKISTSIPTIIKNSQPTKKIKKDLPPSVVVFQHNNLIEARYSLTLQEKKIILWLTSQIKPDDKDFKKHMLTVREFMNLMELKGHANYKELQKITLGLMKKVLIIKEPDLKVITQVAWLSSARYEEGEGFIKLSFAPEMHPFLLQLKDRFTAISITDLMQFKSIHAIRIYELLKQYQDIGERTLTIDEINKAYELRNNPVKETQEVKRKPAVIDTLREFGLSLRVINHILKENTEQTIQNAINAVDLQLSRGQVRNTKAMLMTAIKEQW
ncbi:MAG: RepB family plasmid replication initiator protein, partial [Actinobacteria bacterium]|nr:RepB family plasmid replication initiator protein [Actinomycetota bacterium]